MTVTFRCCNQEWQCQLGVAMQCQLHTGVVGVAMSVTFRCYRINVSYIQVAGVCQLHTGVAVTWCCNQLHSGVTGVNG